LVVSFARADRSGKELLPARYVDELLETDLLEVEVRGLPTQMTEGEALLLREVELTANERPEAEVLDRLLEDFALSATSLDRLLTCPLSFYYEYVLRVPVGGGTPARYGTAVHAALEWAFKKMLRHRANAFPDVGEVMEMFRARLQRQRASFGDEEYRQFEQQGLLLLPRYLHQRMVTWEREVEIERSFSHVEFEGIPLTGKIDKLVFLPKGELVVVDYKTGSYKPKDLYPPSEKLPTGGRYWRQLQFYRLLVEQSRLYEERIIRSGRLDFVSERDGRFPEEDLLFTREDAEAFEALVLAAWQRIVQRDFFVGCGDPDCHWCRFQRTRRAPDSFTDDLRAELDDPS
jgi:DNA helicase-2/ATP-dependent DNA helicase PcrA